MNLCFFFIYLRTEKLCTLQVRIMFIPRHGNININVNIIFFIILKWIRNHTTPYFHFENMRLECSIVFCQQHIELSIRDCEFLIDVTIDVKRDAKSQARASVWHLLSRRGWWVSFSRTKCWSPAARFKILVSF